MNKVLGILTAIALAVVVWVVQEDGLPGVVPAAGTLAVAENDVRSEFVPTYVELGAVEHAAEVKTHTTRPMGAPDDVTFVPADEQSAPLPNPPNAHPMTALGGSFAAAPPQGYVDHIVSLSPATDIDEFGRNLEQLDGTVLRYFSNLNTVAVRLPADNIEHIKDLDGVGHAAPDSTIEFMSRESREAARLPATAHPQYVDVDASIGVAVIDTGVASHEDINLASRVTLAAPETILNSNLRNDSALKALYLFDEGRGSRIFDRVGGTPTHLDHFADASKLMHPDTIPMSSLYSKSSTSVSFTINNASDHAIEVFWVDYSGNKVSFGTVQPGNGSNINSQKEHPWIIANASTGRHEGLIYDLSGGSSHQIYFRGVPAAYSGGKLKVHNGNFANYSSYDAIGPACTAANCGRLRGLGDSGQHDRSRP